MAVTCLAGLLPAVKANTSYSDVLQAVTAGLLLWAVGDTSGLPLAACIVAISLLSGLENEEQCCSAALQQVTTIKAGVRQPVSAKTSPPTPMPSASSGAGSLLPVSGSSTTFSLRSQLSYTSLASAPTVPAPSLGQQKVFVSAASLAPATCSSAPEQPWALQAADAVDLAGLRHPFAQPHLLGQGGMGQVVLMQDVHSRALLAVKAPLRPGGQMTPQTAADMEREHAMNTFAMLNGPLPHVTGYMGPLVQQGQLNGSLAFEFLEGGSLASNLRMFHAAGRALPLPVRAQLLLQVCKGVRSLHDRGLLHADLKADNVLLDTCLNVCDTQWRGIAKVADLGLSTVVDPYTGLVAEQMSCGTLPYMAPELFQGSPVSQAVDAYAFGMLMWELFHQAQPHTGMSPLHVKAAMTFGSMLPRCSLGMEASYQAIMLACWESQPCMRPTMATLEELLQLLL